MQTEILAEELGLTLDEFREILDLYTEATTCDLEALTTAIADGNAPMAHERAHSLKGASANLGLEELYLIAKEIDDRARAGSLDGLDGLVARFKAAYEKIMEGVARDA